MKKTITLFSFVAVSAIVLKTSVLHSEIPSPPVGSSGAPPSGTTCARGGCHTGTAMVDASKTMFSLASDSLLLSDSSSIVTSATQYNAGVTYYAVLKLNGSALDYGFQIVSLSNSNSQSGSFAVNDAVHTKLQTSGSIQYMGHKNANANSTFNFKWTAPTTDDTVNFYYAVNFGNGNANASGDNVYYGSVAITKAVSSGIATVSSVQNFNVYPTQTLSNVAVKLNSQISQIAEISLVDMSGKLVKTLHNGNLNAGENYFVFDISELPQGAYLLSLKAGNMQTAKHIVKL